jgi:hypothetical protein
MKQQTSIIFLRKGNKLFQIAKKLFGITARPIMSIYDIGDDYETFIIRGPKLVIDTFVKCSHHIKSLDAEKHTLALEAFNYFLSYTMGCLDIEDDDADVREMFLISLFGKKIEDFCVECRRARRCLDDAKKCIANKEALIDTYYDCLALAQKLMREFLREEA